MNPIILKGIRENLRPKHLIAAGLFSLIICSTVYLTSYLEGSEGKYSLDPETKEWVKEESSPVNGARNAFTFLLALQGFYLMFLGTGRVASITAEERESGLLDYQRMTPMNPLSKIIGYIFGIPAREYFRWHQDKQGCWGDKAFTNEFFRDNPHLKAKSFNKKTFVSGGFTKPSFA